MSTLSVALAIVAIQARPRTVSEIAEICSLSEEGGRKVLGTLRKADLIEFDSYAPGTAHRQGMRPALWRWKEKKAVCSEA